jgi:preprotein translocase subunit YajC
MEIAILIFFFAIFYLLILRPQTKRAKEHREMVAALEKGDEVIAGGGILGKVTDVKDSFITVKVGDNVSLNIQRQAVSQVLPKGTIKEAAN